MFYLSDQELDDIRRSPQWRFEIDRFIDSNEFEDTEEHRRILGELPELNVHELIAEQYQHDTTVERRNLFDYNSGIDWIKTIDPDNGVVTWSMAGDDTRWRYDARATGQNERRVNESTVPIWDIFQCRLGDIPRPPWAALPSLYTDLTYYRLLEMRASVQWSYEAHRFLNTTDIFSEDALVILGVAFPENQVEHLSASLPTQGQQMHPMPRMPDRPDSMNIPIPRMTDPRMTDRPASMSTIPAMGTLNDERCGYGYGDYGDGDGGDVSAESNAFTPDQVAAPGAQTSIGVTISRNSPEEGEEITPIEEVEPPLDESVNDVEVISHVPDIGNQAKRKFGVEIEFLAPLAMVEVCQAINESGITCRQESYNHRRRDWWKIVPDASIHGLGLNPMEVVSRPLKGNDGLIEVEKVVKVINDIGGKVNKNCGLHVHVEASRLKIEQLRNVAIAWVTYEHIIESMIPQSRRNGSERRYCQSIINYRDNSEYSRERLMDRLYASYNKRRIVNLMNPQYDRMLKLNFQALSRHGTLEFRHHSGTCNTKKILHHIRFCIAFVNHFKNTVIDMEADPIPCLYSLLNKIVNELPVRMKEDFISYYHQRYEELVS